MFLFEKDIDGGKQIFVMPLTYGRARIGIGVKGSMSIDDVY